MSRRHSAEQANNDDIGIVIMPLFRSSTSRISDAKDNGSKRHRKQNADFDGIICECNNVLKNIFKTKQYLSKKQNPFSHVFAGVRSRRNDQVSILLMRSLIRNSTQAICGVLFCFVIWNIDYYRLEVY